MKIASGRVVGGKVVFDGPIFVEGVMVTVLARGDNEPFEVSPEMEAALLEAIGEANRGETAGGDECSPSCVAGVDPAASDPRHAQSRPRDLRSGFVVDLQSPRGARSAFGGVGASLRVDCHTTAPWRNGRELESIGRATRSPRSNPLLPVLPV